MGGGTKRIKHNHMHIDEIMAFDQASRREMCAHRIYSLHRSSMCFVMYGWCWVSIYANSLVGRAARSEWRHGHGRPLRWVTIQNARGSSGIGSGFSHAIWWIDRPATTEYVLIVYARSIANITPKNHMHMRLRDDDRILRKTATHRHQCLNLARRLIRGHKQTGFHTVEKANAFFQADSV